MLWTAWNAATENRSPSAWRNSNPVVRERGSLYLNQYAPVSRRITPPHVSKRICPSPFGSLPQVLGFSVAPLPTPRVRHLKNKHAFCVGSRPPGALSTASAIPLAPHLFAARGKAGIAEKPSPFPLWGEGQGEGKKAGMRRRTLGPMG